jgi:hypothetical protein
MIASKKPMLRLKSDALVPAEDDKLVELAVYDVLLPCRRFEVDYKVAVLGRVSPSLEFLLRLVKSVSGIEEEAVATFFGFSPAEMQYVLQEAVTPSYVERRDGRLWLTPEGEALFMPGEENPSLYEVHPRHGSYGFDLLSIAPQRPPRLELAELHLPEFTATDGETVGKASQRVGKRFKTFFSELGDARDRDRYERRDLYSVDSVAASDRFHAPVRIRVRAAASNPSVPEIDLSSWRPESEILDRPEVEQAAGRFVDDLRVSRNEANDLLAYQTLIDMAPEFLKDFTTQRGLAVSRYWREAVSRAGEPRADRQTVALVGSLFTQDNAERLAALFDYGARGRQGPPDTLISVAPQMQHWGATTQLRDTIALLKAKIEAMSKSEDDVGLNSHCMIVGRPARYLERMFDRVHQADYVRFPSSLEILLIPGTIVAISVHSPIGAFSGLAAPLGFGSFDKEVVRRAQALLLDNVDAYVRDENALNAIRTRCSDTGPAAEDVGPGVP